ncbi:polysaccharide biosynthesis protein CapD [Hyphomicrobium denitrificans 1NES1]|uniref:Polysaccharide biosynthesis protein CapD n=2 Tax=Hyphomicrobium denitrificans TaxID=53399 RepID=N0B6Y4_9HYPH|nr:polysaccharide biosynthesis protein CapD [Hyphomicrobium denitrificans 1NES1]
MPRYHKRAVLIVVDFILLSIALWVPLSLRFGVPYVPPTGGVAFVLVLAAPLTTIATLWRFKVYRVVTRFVGYRGTTQIALAVGLSTLIWALFVFMSGQNGMPRSVIIPYGIFGAVLLIGTRYAIKAILNSADITTAREFSHVPPKPTLIYGAGRMGIELLKTVRRARDRDIVAFIDSSPTLWRQYAGGIKVYPPSRLAGLIESESVCEVLVALSGSQKQERREVLKQLEQLPVSVKVLPAYEDFTSGHVGVNSLRDVDVNDLLGRDPVMPRPELLARNTRGKSVLVTGAGGSIGAELVRQVMRQSPRLVVLLEISEPALYRIELEMSEALAKLPADVVKPRLVPVLGSAGDDQLVNALLTEHRVETIYHAAAYKHVPMVECNPTAGITNNVLGTLVIAKAAVRCGVERFVLISTDKAVRPTNIMGASKRLSELVLQAEAAKQIGTVFTAVRFGNVLDSSGSVVPRFRKQIGAGGPVTVTHPDVVRYFMSISEAAELVVQAGAMATGGEVFVLQMGEPVRILDLARLMVRLSNREVRDESNPDGDIDIVFTGLRPGEKLFEELLIGARTEVTEHPRIYKSDEPFLSWNELKHELDVLKLATEAHDMAALRSVLMRTVEGYRPGSDSGPGEDALKTRSDEQVLRTIH